MPLPTKGYHSHADLIRPDRTFNRLLNLPVERNVEEKANNILQKE